MEEMFDIEKFNVISDEENYYFFRSLEPGDIKDLEEGNIKDENGNYIRIRTDRERWEETHSIKPRWNAESTVTLEEMYNHIKTPYSLETNCISLSSNANVARTYGETFSDKYVMIKVPKKEMGQRVYNAGQYMLSEIARKVQERIAQGNIPEEVLEDLKKIDEATKPEDLKEIIKVKYTAPKGIDTSKSGMKKGIVYKAPLSRISSFQALDDEQTLEKNKIVAKLTILEQKGLMKPAVSRIKTNSELIKTMGSAFASGEQIYYGDIEGDRIADISKELLDMFVFDAVILNEDRHFGNFGFLIDNKSNKIVGCAPIFDNGLSLLCYAMDDDFKNINQYILTRLPATYQDFITFVKPRMTKRQKEKPRKLIGFKFESHYKYRLPRKRLKYLEEIIQKRVLELLE